MHGKIEVAKPAYTRHTTMSMPRASAFGILPSYSNSYAGYMRLVAKEMTILGQRYTNPDEIEKAVLKAYRASRKVKDGIEVTWKPHDDIRPVMVGALTFTMTGKKTDMYIDLACPEIVINVEGERGGFTDFVGDRFMYCIATVSWNSQDGCEVKPGDLLRLVALFNRWKAEGRLNDEAKIGLFQGAQKDTVTELDSKAEKAGGYEDESEHSSDEEDE